MWALYIQSSGGRKISTIWATNVRTRRMAKKIISLREMTNGRSACGKFSLELLGSSFLRHSCSFSACNHEHIFEMRHIHRRRYPGLAIELTHSKTLNVADQQP